jgi:hypothetical protein
MSTMDADAAELAEQIAETCFGGILPVGFAPIIAASVAEVCCADAPPNVVSEFLESLTLALEARECAQEAPWQN